MMKKLLVINSSPFLEGSNTRKLIERFVALWSEKQGTAEVLYREVGTTPPPQLDALTIGAFYTPEASRSDEQKQALRLSDELIAELESADEVVIGSPMHNFSITAGLKAYIDQVARVGKTFQYTDKGPVGLLANRRVTILSARGGAYAAGTPAALMNHEDAYLKSVLGFIGLSDVVTVAAEGVSGGSEGVARALNSLESVLS